MLSFYVTLQEIENVLMCVYITWCKDESELWENLKSKANLHKDSWDLPTSLKYMYLYQAMKT